MSRKFWIAAGMAGGIGLLAPPSPARADCDGCVVAAVTAALARRWGADPGADEATEGATLTGYHRYELARTLVAALRELPELPERVDPERMADYLAAPAPALPPEPSAPDRVSAGPQADRALAWSRALAAVLEAAADAPFERPPDTVLADARAALTEAVADRVAALDAALPVPAAARPIVEQHALRTSARLYAATLRHVHRESARMIERYRALQAAGAIEDADRLARAYQEGHWGYAGVPHHFRAVLAAHAAQQGAAAAGTTGGPRARRVGPASRRRADGRTCPLILRLFIERIL